MTTVKYIVFKNPGCKEEVVLFSQDVNHSVMAAILHLKSENILRAGFMDINITKSPYGDSVSLSDKKRRIESDEKDRKLLLGE